MDLAGGSKEPSDGGEEASRFQWKQPEGNLEVKTEMFWKAPMIHTAVNNTHHTPAYKHSHGCADTYTLQHAPTCMQNVTRPHFIYLDS